ncbi:MAG: phosphomannomutase/phosphoglucomutase [Cyanobacteria bacterium P01_D01_bin.105]
MASVLSQTLPTEWQRLQNGSDIRGVAIEGVVGEGVTLTPEIVYRIGQGFVSWLAEKVSKETADLVVSVGRDSRLSGPSLRDGLTEGMRSLGTKVYDFAIASTPAMFMSTVTAGYECDGAIMLTASHLPFNRNGLKFFTAQGGLNKPDITAILSLASKNKFFTAATKGEIEERDFITVYSNGLAEKIREGVNHPEQYEQPLKGLHIVVDAGNGAGGFYASKVLVPLGADTSGSQFLEPDGTFPNHIPNPENADAMAALRQSVLENNADFGIIFDTDVDRSAAVDSQGKALNRNKLIALISAVVLREHPGSTVVTDSITSEGLTDFITGLGGVHHRFRRGYKNVINESVRLNDAGQESWLAIETSGHGAMQENYFLDDGAYLVSKLLVELARTRQAGKLITDLIAELKEPAESAEYRLKILAENFRAHGNHIIEALRAFVDEQPDWAVVPKNYEGIRVACTAPEEDGWFLLRLSLHDPVLPLNVESNVTDGVNKICDRLTQFFKRTTALDTSELG